MRYQDKQLVIEFIIKIIIASIALCIIIFYNTTTIEETHTDEDRYQHTIYHHNAGEMVSGSDWSGNDRKHIIHIDTQRSETEKANLKSIIEEVLSFIENNIKHIGSLKTNLKSITINKDQGKSRGYATHDTIIINYGTMSEQEFIQILTHELGHIIDLKLIKGTSIYKNQRFTEFNEAIFEEDDASLGYYALSRESESKRKKTSQKTDFCSIYGMTNIFEDFAECRQLYINHHDYFVSLLQSSSILKHKYTIIDTIVGGTYRYANIDQVGTGDNNYRYRDTTRMQ